MTRLPLGALPPFAEFEARVRAVSLKGTYEMVVWQDEMIMFLSGAINRGLDLTRGGVLESIGASARWIGTKLKVVIRDPRSLYVLIFRLVDMENDVVLQERYEGTPGMMATEILRSLDYEWEEQHGEEGEGGRDGGEVGGVGPSEDPVA